MHFPTIDARVRAEPRQYHCDLLKTELEFAFSWFLPSDQKSSCHDQLLWMLSKHEYFCYVAQAVSVEDSLAFVIIHFMNIIEWKCHIYKILSRTGNKMYGLSSGVSTSDG